MPVALHFKTYLNPSETFIDRLVRNAERYRPVVVTQQKRQYTENLEIHEAPLVGTSGFINRLFTKLDLSSPHLVRQLRRYRPQVVNGHFGRDAFRALPACVALGYPLVVSFYGHDVSRLPTRPLWRLRYRLLASLAQQFICVSEDLRQLLLALGFPEERLRVVHVGIDLDRVPWTGPRGDGRIAPRLLAMGRLVEKKGFEDAIAAVARLKALGSAATLDVIGEGEAQASIERAIAREGVADRVRLCGPLGNRELLERIGSYHVLLAPSVVARDGDREGIPNTILEAMAAGLPVVATRHGGIPELIEHERTGLLVPERDPEALAAATQRLLNSEDLAANLQQAATRHVRDHFSAKAWASGMEAVYDRAIDGFRARR
jgi:colanic acid/amylovoran biosynthesis glycosyltransferase